MHCATCGAILAPSDAACQACGAPVGSAPHNDDPPTETMPAVLLPSSDQPASAAPPEVQLAPPAYVPPAHVPPAQVPPPYVAPAHVPPAAMHTGLPPQARRGRGVLMGVMIGSLAGLLLAVGGFALLNQGSGNNPIGGQSPPAANSTDPAGGATRAPAATTGSEPDGTFRCEAQQLTAPEAAAWQLFRASFGTRPRFDYLTLHLRRTGNADDAAVIRAELLPPAQVPERYRMAAPDGDAALVISLEGTVRIPGSFGGRPGHSALRGFDVDRDGDGTVRVVAGVSGTGCFSMSGQDWQDGAAPRTTEVTFQIERP